VEIRHFRKCLISVNFFDIQNKLKILVFKLDLRALSLESLYSIFLFLLFFALKTFFVATERNALENNLNGLFCSETFQIATSSHIRRKFCIILQFVPILYVLLDRWNLGVTPNKGWKPQTNSIQCILNSITHCILKIVTPGNWASFLS